MTFEPDPGMRLHLGKDEVIEFLPLEESGPASVFVYAESGKEGTVYKVLKNQERYALKVFYPEYRDIRLLENTEKLTRFRDLEGFRVAERNLIEPDEYPQLLRQYPELTYSVLMPWIQGTVWGNLMLDPDPAMQPENYFQIAKTLIRVVNNLEKQGLAHCDLSNNNFIIVNGFSEIQLIDVEDMYAPDMPRPIPDISYGTIGYRTPWIAERGLWGPESDRFSLAILCSEIIAWHNPEIRENRSGNTSFFDEDEIGEESDRFKLMTRYLDSTNTALPGLLEKAWFAKEFAQCPPVSEWFEAVQKIGADNAPELEETLAFDRSATVILNSSEKISGEAESWVVEADQLQQVGFISSIADPASGEAEAQVVAEMETPLVEEVGLQAEEVASSANESMMVGEEEGQEVESDIPQEVETASPEDEEQAEIETLAKKRDGTIPKGVPPKMDINLDNLDFGIVGKPENTRHFAVANSGGAPLVVSIRSEEWINVSNLQFVLAPGEKQIVTATLNAKYPHPKTGHEFRAAFALDVESNAGSEVIGARFIIPKPPFHSYGWKRALLGAIFGTMFGCIIGFLLNDVLACVIVPAILFLFGLAGFTSYPRRSSILLSIAGFVVAEILAFIWASNSYYMPEDSIVSLFGVAGGLGVLGGAIASRILLKKNKSHQASK